MWAAFAGGGIEGVFSFLINQGRSIIAKTIKYATNPRVLIAFVLVYPHFYRNVSTVLEELKATLVDISDQVWSWAVSAFWAIKNWIQQNLSWMPFINEISTVLAGIVAAPVFLVALLIRYVFIPVAQFIVWISLMALAILFNIICKVVVPALKAAFGGYLFYRFLPSSARWFGRLLDRFARGSLLGALGAFAATLTPFAGFFLGYAAISAVVDPACGTQIAVPQPTVGFPYMSYAGYSFGLGIWTSSVAAFIGQYGYSPAVYALQTSASMVYAALKYWFTPPAVSYISAYLAPNLFWIYPTYSYVYSVLTLTSYQIPIYSPYGYAVGYYYYTPYGYYAFADLGSLAGYVYAVLYGIPILPYSYSYVISALTVFPKQIYFYEMSYLAQIPALHVSEYSYLSVLPSVPVSEYSYLTAQPAYPVKEYSYLTSWPAYPVYETSYLTIWPVYPVYELSYLFYPY